jgi:hypothetical protein
MWFHFDFACSHDAADPKYLPDDRLEKEVWAPREPRPPLLKFGVFLNFESSQQPNRACAKTSNVHQLLSPPVAAVD